MIVRFAITGSAAALFDGAPESHHERLTAKVRETLDGAEIHTTVDGVDLVLTLEIDPYAADDGGGR